MLYTDLLLAYGCLFNTNWCKPHPLIAGSNSTENTTSVCNKTKICPTGQECVLDQGTDLGYLIQVLKINIFFSFEET